MYSRKLRHSDLAEIRTAKESASRRVWTHGSGHFWGTMLRDAHSLGTTCRVLKVNLLRSIRNMHKETPEPINVLIEGSGMSTVGEELIQRLGEEGITVKVVKTDIYPPEKFQQLAEEAGIDADSCQYHQLTPEELHKLGENRFHSVISRSAGLTYTKLPKLYGLENVWYVLRPKGEAHILTEHVSFGVEDLGGTKFVSGSPIHLKDFEGETPEGEFLRTTEGLFYQAEGDGSTFILRMKKQAPFEEIFPPDDTDFVPSMVEVTTREEIDAHRTIFHLMEEPPIELSSGQFENLKHAASMMETHHLSKSANLGRSGGVKRRDFNKGLDLMIRYGRYYIVAIDEFGFVDKVLWREEK
ncbi:hypothetical protein KKB44_02725 [Candidatus Micrarchaeota archaeon]|nr:hypothetical protein [Candidatus Micrarchaeota archaeon]